MGTNTLTDRASGQVILDAFFNSIHTAIEGDFVGRNTSGVPASGQNLGTAALPWGSLRASGLIIGGTSIDVSQISAPSFRVISGKSRTTSNQPAFITPIGAAGGGSITIAAAATNLIYDVAGSSFTLSADLVKASLTLATGSNNTALVNDTDAADQESTRTWGERDAEKEEIVIDTIGSAITDFDGTYQSFKINDGSADEFFIALVDTTNNRLIKIQRGFYYDSSLDPINRIKFANNDTITLLNTGYIFLDSDLTTVDVSFTSPVYSFTAPSAPATGDYWFDLQNNLQKRFDGAVFQSVNRSFIGWVALDDTDALGARGVHFDASFKEENTIKLEVNTTAIVRSDSQRQRLDVAGNRIEYKSSLSTWNITTDLATTVDMYNNSEQASTRYYCYIKDTGDTVISDISPYLREDLFGKYHPHNPWRFVGSFFNDSSSDINDVGSESVSKGERIKIVTSAYTALPDDNIIFVDTTGGDIVITLPPLSSMRGRKLYIKKVDAVAANSVTLTPFTGDNIEGETTHELSGLRVGVVVLPSDAEWKILADTQDRVVVLASTNAGQSIATAGSGTAIVYEDIAVNTHSAAYNPSTGLFTAPRDGNYFFAYHAGFATGSFSTTQVIQMFMFKQGSRYNLVAKQYGNGASVNRSQGIADVVPLLEGQTMDARIVQTSGSNRALLAANDSNRLAIFSL